MSDTTPVSGVSGRYATALFELAQESGQLELVEGHMAQLSAALAASADLSAAVSSPLYGRDEQAAALSALCKAMGIGAPTSNLIGLMAAKRRLFALGDVIKGFDALLARHRGIVPAEVRSARPLTAAQRSALEAALAEAAGAKIALDVSVDPSLIGGLVVKLGSRMIDSSIRSKLSQLQTAMKEAAI
ncbi:MAG: F0F1 ATP synthase subunit delta [Rubrimonas sp.]|uniref:F0F1 ATP synthase subunit delta n=1 Tax=Rubrimonas sp. TaxID=2036015 RepID=UPI002FDCE98E